MLAGYPVSFRDVEDSDLMLHLAGTFAGSIEDMVDVEVYKCSENVEWPPFTLSDVYSMIEF